MDPTRVCLPMPPLRRRARALCCGVRGARSCSAKCYEMEVSQLSERLAAFGPTTLQLLRFSVVGGLGTVTNLVLFYFLVDVGGMAPLLGAVLCFAVAVSLFRPLRLRLYHWGPQDGA